MEFLAYEMGITANTGVCNTCLGTHLTIGLLQSGVISVSSLMQSHMSFMFNYFHSTEMRDFEVGVPDFMYHMQVMDKSCVKVIQHHPGGDFVNLPDIFGNIARPKIILIHSINHFFLGKEIN